MASVTIEEGSGIELPVKLVKVISVSVGLML